MSFFGNILTWGIGLLLTSIPLNSQIPSDDRIVLVSDAGTRNDIDSWYPLPGEKPEWFKVPDDNEAQANLIISILQAGATAVFVVGDEPVYQSLKSEGKINRTGRVFHINVGGPLFLHGMYDIENGKRWSPALKNIGGQNFFNVGLWTAGALSLKTKNEKGFEFIPSTRRYAVVAYEQWAQKDWWTSGAPKIFEGKFIVLGDLNVNKKEEIEWRKEKRNAETRFGLNSHEGRLIKNSVIVADLIGSALWKFEKEPDKEP